MRFLGLFQWPIGGGGSSDPRPAPATQEQDASPTMDPETADSPAPPGAAAATLAAAAAESTLAATQGLLEELESHRLPEQGVLDASGRRASTVGASPAPQQQRRAARVLKRLVNLVLFPIRETLFFLSWITWLFSVAMMAGSSLLVVYSLIRISYCFFLFWLVYVLTRLQLWGIDVYHKLTGWLLLTRTEQEVLRLKRSLAEASSYEEWLGAATRLDQLCGADAWKLDETVSQDAGATDYPMLRTYLNRIAQARRYGDVRALMFILNNVWSRDFCGVESEHPYSGCLVGTKRVLDKFYSRTVEQLDFVAGYPTQRPRRRGSSGLGGSSSAVGSRSPMSEPAAHGGAGRFLDEDEDLLAGSGSGQEVRSPAMSAAVPGTRSAHNSTLARGGPQIGSAGAAQGAAWRPRNSNVTPAPGSAEFEEPFDDPELELVVGGHLPQPLTAREKIRFFERARKSYGRTALCLSGGGALALYHIGVVKALLRSDCLPEIINGSSGGSIVAGMLAIKTEEELRDPEFLTETVSSRYGVQWLWPFPRQIIHLLRHGTLMDYRSFAHTAQAYYEDYTFEEAFRRTRRVVSITTSKSGGRKSHSLVLNHVTAPNVLVWSAVCASCALPGLMKPQRLLAKTHDGRVVPFFPRGSAWVDGSLQADIPFRRLSELFDVNRFIVSQVNPHVTVFAVDGQMDGQSRWLYNASRFVNADIQHRLRRLARMGVIPRLYGQDISRIMPGEQKYSGHITIYPRIRFRMQFKLLSHPTDDDMGQYIDGGERGTWGQIPRIRNSLILERHLSECLRRLKRERAARRRQILAHRQPAPGLIKQLQQELAMRPPIPVHLRSQQHPLLSPGGLSTEAGLVSPTFAEQKFTFEQLPTVLGSSPSSVASPVSPTPRPEAVALQDFRQQLQADARHRRRRSTSSRHGSRSLGSSPRDVSRSMRSTPPIQTGSPPVLLTVGSAPSGSSVSGSLVVAAPVVYNVRPPTNALAENRPVSLEESVAPLDAAPFVEEPLEPFEDGYDEDDDEDEDDEVDDGAFDDDDDDDDDDETDDDEEDVHDAIGHHHQSYHHLPQPHDEEELIGAGLHTGWSGLGGGSPSRSRLGRTAAAAAAAAVAEGGDSSSSPVSPRGRPPATVDEEEAAAAAAAAEQSSESETDSSQD